MKRLKWTTTQEWVDVNTGEMLTEQQVKETHIIIRKIKKNEITERYVRERNGSQTLTKFGIVKITNECTRAGKQQQLF